MSFLPQTQPGNLRPPLSEAAFGNTVDTVAPYERNSNYLALIENDSGASREYVSMLLKVYDDSFSQRGIETQFQDPATNGASGNYSGYPYAAGQVGHSNYLRLNIATTQDGDDDIIINWDDSPSAGDTTVSEGQITRYYNFEDMSATGEGEDLYGCYRQARVRIRPSADDGRFTRIDLADQEHDSDDDDGTTGYDYESNHYTSTSHQYSRGADIVDLKIKLLTDPAADPQECIVELAYPMPLRKLERLHIDNDTTRPVQSGNDSDTQFFMALHSLEDIIEAPYYTASTGRSNRYRWFYGCYSLRSLPESFADPERNIVHKYVKNMQQMFEYCRSLKHIPNNFFTAFQDSPGHKLEYCANFAYMFRYANSIEFIPEIPFRDPPDVAGAIGTVGRTQSTNDFSSTSTTSHTRVQHMFRNAFSLKRIPDGLHLRDIWRGDTNAYSSSTEAGVSYLMDTCNSLRDLNGINLDEMPEADNCSPNYPRRLPGFLFMTSTGRGNGFVKMPYFGNWRQLGYHFQDAAASGVDHTTTGMNNDAYRMFDNWQTVRSLDSKYQQQGLNVAYMSDHGEIFSGWYNINDMKVRFIDNSPVRWKEACSYSNATAKDLSTFCLQAAGTSGQTTQDFYRMFKNQNQNYCTKLIGMKHKPALNGEYFEMFENDWRLRVVDGIDLSKANDSGDYGDIFNGCRNLERIGVGDVQDKCGTFDGSDDFINTNLPGTTISPNSAHAITLSAVAEIDTLSATEGFGRLIVIGAGVSTRAGIEINKEDDGSTGRAHFRIGGTHYASDGTGTGATAVAIPTGEKVHVCATLNYSNSTNISEMKLYVDGVLTHVATNQTSSTRDTTTVKVGCNGDSSAHFFDGKIHDIRIYDDILTDEEVSDLAKHLIYKEYRKNEKAVDDNMQLHYTFEEGIFLSSRNTVYDRAQHRGVMLASTFNGTVSGATSSEFWANYEKLGPKYSFTIDNSHMTPRAMVEFFVSLPTVSSGTLTISDNDYIDLLSDEEKEVATDKGWTLSLSGA